MPQMNQASLCWPWCWSSLPVRVRACVRVLTRREEAGLPPVSSPTLPRISATIAVVSSTADRDTVRESILDPLQSPPFKPQEAEDMEVMNSGK